MVAAEPTADHLLLQSSAVRGATLQHSALPYAFDKAYLTTARAWSAAGTLRFEDQYRE